MGEIANAALRRSRLGFFIQVREPNAGGFFLLGESYGGRASRNG
jgi:hypothetical protein